LESNISFKPKKNKILRNFAIISIIFDVEIFYLPTPTINKSYFEFMKAVLNPRPCFSFLLVFGFFAIHSAQAQEKKQSVFEYLTAQEAIKLTLSTDYTELLAGRKKNEYQPATLSNEAGKVFNVEIRPRGKFRRKTCEVPPVKIKFSKKALRSEGLDTLNEMKLVMPCYNNDRGNELVIKEYLTYRMFEHLTQASVRARLIKLTLIDTHVEKKRTMYAILLEDQEETIARIGGTLVEAYGTPADSLITNQAALVTMFEYMIGNTDWEISMMRNVRLVRSNSPEGKILVVPYDFDFSGLVSAPYASPSSESGLKNVRERFLMSNGLQLEHLRRATRQIYSARNELLALCDSKHLSRSASADMKQYLESFFSKAAESDQLPEKMKAPAMD
jgi:hypothetical protein